MLQRAGDLADGAGGDLAIERRGVELLVPEQDPRLRGGRLWITRMSTFCSAGGLLS
jgi:hypothetical protein